MESRSELDKQIKNYRSKISKLVDRKDKLIREEKLPSLIKKYEGKYFKYKNGYNSTERWDIFIYCVKVVDLDRLEIIKIEKTCRGKVEIEHDEFAHQFYVEEEEITREQFLRQSRPLFKELKDILYS